MVEQIGLAHGLLLFLHILLFVYWLGGDVGVFYSSTFVTDTSLSREARLTAFKIFICLGKNRIMSFYTYIHSVLNPCQPHQGIPALFYIAVFDHHGRTEIASSRNQGIISIQFVLYGIGFEGFFDS